jgi:hypothetical protein
MFHPRTAKLVDEHAQSQLFNRNTFQHGSPCPMEVLGILYEKKPPPSFIGGGFDLLPCGSDMT